MLFLIRSYPLPRSTSLNCWVHSYRSSFHISHLSICRGSSVNLLSNYPRSDSLVLFYTEGNGVLTWGTCLGDKAGTPALSCDLRSPGLPRRQGKMKGKACPDRSFRCCWWSALSAPAASQLPPPGTHQQHLEQAAPSFPWPHLASGLADPLSPGFPNTALFRRLQTLS